MSKKSSKPVGVLENRGAPRAEARGMWISTMTGGTIGGDVKEVEGENTKTGSGIGTGGEGSITQWVHAEYMEGSETICLAFTQWVRGGYFSKVPTKVPTG